MIYILIVLFLYILVLSIANYRLVKINKSNSQKLDVASSQLRQTDISLWEMAVSKNQQMEEAVHTAWDITRKAKEEFRSVRQYRNFMEAQKRKNIRKKKGRKSRKRSA
ncbi:hypothetical protein [Cytobacillus firmus]|uniref:hypothetical protein n=1 Tax=Cytobacillus firmus TaxID=1399 RepID=UPI0018CE9AA3|nr:hypothetical protein [Cytobacillus firmus]MBG9548402.1 hypothetical protein [Cytobacillus firmus]MBG9604506.1 hypothetical protein [Cytobacillus firmus]MED1942120.1 hypothetical protein [Cytobacillus firmus]